MSKFHCTCGTVSSDVVYPAAQNAMLFTDVAMDKHGGYEATFEHVPSRDVIECHACGRLWVQEAPGADKYLGFSPDTKPLNIVDEGGKYRG